MGIGLWSVFYGFYPLYDSYIDIKSNLLFLGTETVSVFLFTKKWANECAHIFVCLLHLLGLNLTNWIVGSKYMHILRRVWHMTHQKGCINSAPTAWNTHFPTPLPKHFLIFTVWRGKIKYLSIFTNNDIQMFFHTFASHLIASIGKWLFYFLYPFFNCGTFLCTENINPLITFCVPNMFSPLVTHLVALFRIQKSITIEKPTSLSFYHFFLGFLSFKRAFPSQEQINNLFYILN